MTAKPFILLLLCGLSGLCAKPALAQAPNPLITHEPADRAKPASIPGAPDAVDQLLAAAYLTPDQLKDKRIFFGRYSADDLDSPARVARAALARAVYDDPALAADDADADALDRAEAAAERGDFEAATTLLNAQPAPPSPRAVRIRASMLEDQARFDDAVHAAEPVIAALAAGKLTSAEDITEAVRLAALRVRLRGPSNDKDAAGDYHKMMARLDDVLNRVDRLYWPAALLQAELLAEKDNKQEAIEALKRVVQLNPSCAGAWAQIGRRMVEGFQFDHAESVAKRLDLLASDFWTGDDPDPLPEEFASLDPGAVSPDAAMIIARECLRQSEGAQALTILEPFVKRYPHSPRLLALKCAAEAVKFDFAACDASLAEFDRLFGASPLAQYEVGKALSEARQYGPSRIHLEEAARRQANAPEPYIELGLMLLQAGKDVDALSALERGYALDPFNVRADNSLRLARELQTYASVETPHYIIRYKPGPAPDGSAGDSLLAHEMSAPLESNYAIVTGSPDGGAGGIDYEPKTKTIIDLMPDHKWFGVRIAGMPAIHTIAASTGPVIAMESPRDGADHLGPYDWVRVLRHEFTHTVTLGRTSNRIPHWFTEAAAVYLEQAPRDWQTCVLLASAHKQNKLFDFSTINLAFIRPKRPIDRSQAYAQGMWMYEYIVERAGARAPLDLMDKYAAGVREEEAFHSVLGVSRAQFLADFMEWSRKQIVAWGLDVPEGTPSLHQLLAREALAAPDVAEDAKPALQRIADGHPTEDDDDVDLPEPKPEMVAAWLEKYPTQPDVLELAVDEAVEKTDGKATPESVALIERYAAARPVDPKPHRLLAKMYLDAAAADPANLAAEAAKAIPHLEYLDAREQKTATYAMELAKRYEAIGDLAHAKAKAQRATQLDPFNPRPRELAAAIAIQAKDWPGAEHQIKALIEIEPTRAIHKQRLEALEKLKNQGR